MAEHRASVTVNAPAHHVYELFSHFNDYPKFMTHVKEVTYLDDQRSHWVVDMAGRYEWDAINEDWIPDQQIAWRSTSGVANRGNVRFEAHGDTTRVSVWIAYEPPGGGIGTLAEALGGGALFDTRLQHDLEHFARMVDEAPPNALDPTSSAYLFHDDSAAVKGETTAAQDQTMGIGDSVKNLPPESLPSTTSTTRDSLL